MYKIMIAEDDNALAAEKKHIESWNYEVICVRNYDNILDEFKSMNLTLSLWI